MPRARRARSPNAHEMPSHEDGQSNTPIARRTRSRAPLRGQPAIQLPRRTRRRQNRSPQDRSRSPVDRHHPQPENHHFTCDECHICSQPCQEGAETMRLICSHLFHAGCIQRWLNHRGTCPVCHCRIRQNRALSFMMPDYGKITISAPFEFWDDQNPVSIHFNGQPALHGMPGQDFPIAPVPISRPHMWGGQGTPLSNQEREEDPCCSICLEEVGEGAPTTKLPCSHSFHDDCIMTWMNQTTSCPLCRQEITWNTKVLFDLPDGYMLICVPGKLWSSDLAMSIGFNSSTGQPSFQFRLDIVD